ncbi:hypothetical protein P7K49_013123 [Saguinus oedipus]|uniref:Uncharacterized protein n=1 Tax=Saguinus oedipus TaxID=9490 RepID=A0ABQ9VEZ9_SAGOE|nr:hypothetical protein P7K49_013123 [Saguinus oedipus]
MKSLDVQPSLSAEKRHTPQTTQSHTHARFSHLFPSGHTASFTCLFVSRRRDTRSDNLLQSGSRANHMECQRVHWDQLDFLLQPSPKPQPCFPNLLADG